MKLSPERMEEFVRGMPKVELHLHLEGTMEPDLLLRLAAKNSVELPLKTKEEVQKAYDFDSLQSFLDLYYEGMSVLFDEGDFFDLAWAYLRKMKMENTRHVEVFFDPQPHMQRGIEFATVVNGFHGALQKAKDELGISFKLIMCFVRHLSIEDALVTLEKSRDHKTKIFAVGLDSTEQDNPPIKYKDLFEKAREFGYECVAHAGEEGPASYVRGAMDDLKVSRVDHGVRCTEDPALLQTLVANRLPLTMCPISNCKLCVVKNMAQHPIKSLLDQGICVTVNSDDPAYFGGYLTDNYLAVAEEPSFGMTTDDVIKLAQNSIDATFLTSEEKEELRSDLMEYEKSFAS